MPKKLTLGSIRTDGGTQVRIELDQETFLEYGQQMAAGAKFPPVDVFFDGSEYWLSDGFHRFYGARESGLACIEAKVHNGTVRDAILFAIGANATHGRPRTNKDKRHAVEMLLADEKWREWGDVKLAEVAAVDQSTVSRIRNELLQSKGYDLPATTIGKDGKRRKKPKKRKPKIPAPTFIDDEPEADDKQDASGDTAQVSSEPFTDKSDSAGVVETEPGAADKYLDRLIEWTRKQMDNIDDLTWTLARSVWLKLAESDVPL